MDISEMLEIFKALFAGNEPEKVKELMESLMNTLMIIERNRHNGAENYEHSDERRSYSNGFKPRQLKSRFGVLELLNPQTRGGEPFHSEMFGRFQRSDKALFVAASQMYFNGVSTRKVADIFEEVYGTKISPQFVSNAAADLDAQIEAWRSTSFSKEIPYIYIDAMYVKARNGLSVVSKGVLVASGIDIDGYRRVLDFMVADTESEATYTELFTRLKDRGLHGVRMVISDAHLGLRNAINKFFDGASWQRCRFHFMRDFINKIHKKADKEEVTRRLKEIYAQASLEDALKKAEEFAEYLKSKNHHKLATDLSEQIEQTLQYFSVVKNDKDEKKETWYVDTLDTALRKLSTSNHIERINRELRRRTNVVSIFPNEASVARLVGTLLIEMDEEWLTGKKYVTFID